MERVYHLQWFGSWYGYLLPLIFWIISNICSWIFNKFGILQDRIKVMKKYGIPLLLMLQCLFIFLWGKEIVTLYVPYITGNCGVVEGKVENFSSDEPMENFYVGDIRFCYDGELLTIAYHRLKSEGGVFRENGQYVRIQYVEHKGQNVIVEVWVEKAGGNDGLEINNDVSP